MTPINFTAFIVSLLIVDVRHSLQRSDTYNHSFYSRWFYHSNQKQLMKMEADEAFRLRKSALILIASVMVVLVASIGYMTTRLVHRLFAFVPS
jgi:hypothetical protein